MMKIMFTVLLTVFLGMSALETNGQGVLNSLSLVGGQSYFQKMDQGDGTYYFTEFRWLPISASRRPDVLRLGFYVNYFSVGSKINEFLFLGEEASLGASLNFNPRYFSYQRDAYVWLNLGYKVGESQGEEGLYREANKSQSLIFSGGIILKHLRLKAPFALQKIYVAYQQDLQAQEFVSWSSSWTDSNEMGDAYIQWEANWEGERKYKHYSLQFSIENTFVSLPIVKSGKLRFDPKIIAGVRYEAKTGKKNIEDLIDLRPSSFRIYYSTGIGFNLTGEYNQEILSCTYSTQFDQAPERTDLFSITLNLIEAIKTLKK